MADPFSISSTRFPDSADAAMHDEIRAHTDTDAEASSIVRCIERFGADPSIRHFEITPTRKASRFGGRSSTAWNVRAIR
jgi:hypothetical protein